MKRPYAWFDLETYRNYFLCKFLFENPIGAVSKFTFLDYMMVPGTVLDRQAILNILAHYTVIGFNSNGYDVPILSLALAGANNQTLKDANDLIILRGMKPWTFYEHFNVQSPACLDTIDIFEILPGVRISLKAYGGISHAKTIQDLPVDPMSDISPIQYYPMSLYCGNDLTTTHHLTQIAIEKEWLPLRELISAEIGIDVRSKSDAQIAEAITKSKLGYKPVVRQIPHGFQFTYTAPACIKFQTEQLNEVLRIVQFAPYKVLLKDEDSDEVDENGKPIKSGIKMHKDIAKIRVHIGKGVYKFGSGGLHSQESSVFYLSDDDYEISDDDVGSFYPKIIITQKLYSKECGPNELIIYTGTYTERMAAKVAKRKKEANSKKIVLNGKFGKLGSRYSFFYAPELLIQTTLTGQLMLLMLIEALESAGIEVVSANTDGIVTRCHKSLTGMREMIMRMWEYQTDMELEKTRYKGIYFRDVNNYFAITTDGEVKRKGVFTPPEVGSGPSSSKAPAREICYDAVIAYVQHGTPIEHTIYKCRDIRKFVSVKNVKGGAIGPDGELLGKVVRWAYRRDYTGIITSKTNGNQVADSTGAWPMMTLTDSMPDWIDYEYYVRHAYDALRKVGLSEF